jgi:hypothetical protein
MALGIAARINAQLQSIADYGETRGLRRGRTCDALLHDYSPAGVWSPEALGVTAPGASSFIDGDKSGGEVFRDEPIATHRATAVCVLDLELVLAADTAPLRVDFSVETVCVDDDVLLELESELLFFGHCVDSCTAVVPLRAMMMRSRDLRRLMRFPPVGHGSRTAATRNPSSETNTPRCGMGLNPANLQQDSNLRESMSRISGLPRR